MALTMDARWVSYRCIAYLSGRGIVWGAGEGSPLPREAKDPKKYAITIDDRKLNNVECIDNEYSLLANDASDFVFVGWRIMEVPNTHVVLAGLVQKLKVGGHIVIHCGKDADFTKFLGSIGAWRTKINEVNNDQRVLVLKLLPYTKIWGVKSLQRPTTKRACVVRYGAIGDAVMLTPVIKKLHEDGYEVTLNITPYCKDVFLHNPYVSNIIIQERDAIPNQELGEYWALWAREYDRYINLSESIEGSLLKVEWKTDFYTPKSQRATTTNYYQQMLTLSGYAEEPNVCGELFVQPEEEAEARIILAKVGVDLSIHKVVLWALNGSSGHKIVPLAQQILTEWLPSHPGVRVVLMGDQRAKELEFQMPKVVSLVGKISVRQMLVLTKLASVVFGPESALVNAASCWKNCGKVVVLSHSAPENLTSTWSNVYTIQPHTACYPCYQLHHSYDSCPLVQILDPDTDAHIADVPCCTVGYTAKEVAGLLDRALIAS